jgi:hypothetical protein
MFINCLASDNVSFVVVNEAIVELATADTFAGRYMHTLIGFLEHYYSSVFINAVGLKIQ